MKPLLVDLIQNSDSPSSFRPARIGIMGGTFDPPHLGHLVCAEMAMDACKLACVVFMPAARQPFKSAADCASVADRLEMCRLATASNPNFRVSNMEARRAKTTYTLDTAKELRLQFGESVEFSFIIGTDSLLTLPYWHGAAELASLMDFICVSRPGSEGNAGNMEELKTLGFDIRMVKAPLLDISSSEIRKRIASRRSVRYLTPQSVFCYIKEHGLYFSKSQEEADE